MLKRFFSKPAVSRVEEKSFFFPVLYLGIMRLEGAETLVQHLQFMTRIMLEEKKF